MSKLLSPTEVFLWYDVQDEIQDIIRQYLADHGKLETYTIEDLEAAARFAENEVYQ